MNYECENKKIVKRINHYIATFPEKTFHEILNMCGCSPVEYVGDVSNPEIGKYGVADKRLEPSESTMLRMNEVLMKKPIYEID